MVGVTVGIVTCQHCGSETPLETVDENGDTCPDCGADIDPDAPVTIPTELAEGNWDKIRGDDYEPIGGVDFAADEISEPERDVESITETLTAAEAGDVLAMTIGIAEAYSETALYVLSHERDTNGFDHRLNIVEKPRDDGWTRLYITTLGHSEFDPWEVVSAPYHLERKTVDTRDFASNGWVVDARETDGDVERAKRNPERETGDRP